jgi:predicted O-linked N-acetylglucosamine transferase (SPINDLY family)
MTWQKQRHFDQAYAAYNQALAYNPNLVDAWVNSAQTLAQMERHGDALAAARRAVDLAPDYIPALRTMGAVLCDGDEKEEDAAYPWMDKVIRAEPHNPVALLYLIDRDVTHCNWDNVEIRLPALRALIAKGQVLGMQPFRLLSLPFTPAELCSATTQSCSLEYSSLSRQSVQQVWGNAIGKGRPEKLRIGYFSADYHDHATMHLMIGFFEAHDKSRFETIGICLGEYKNRPDSEMRKRARRSFDRFEVTEGMSEEKILALSRELKLDIAVDLKGHTKEARMAIFVHRVAPVQMHYIGFPGTLGLPGSIDYLVADRVLIPENLREFYTEKIIEMPDTYQVNDRHRVIDPIKPSRMELGLPADAFVFCCFNNHYKINRPAFDLWMELLRRIPKSVLWLLCKNDEAAYNLKQAVQKAGVSSERVIFAQATVPSRHLARHAQADLFLDTWPYNAHTTASDALWSGLPTLTYMGQTYASRVCASLLTACNLPELITRTPQEYFDRALELAQDPQQLGKIRQKLADIRLSVPLFDTERFTRHMENAYDQVWNRFSNGLAPDHISL